MNIKVPRVCDFSNLSLVCLLIALSYKTAVTTHLLTIKYPPPPISDNRPKVDKLQPQTTPV